MCERRLRRGQQGSHALGGLRPPHRQRLSDHVPLSVHGHADRLAVGGKGLAECAAAPLQVSQLPHQQRLVSRQRWVHGGTALSCGLEVLRLHRGIALRCSSQALCCRRARVDDPPLHAPAVHLRRCCRHSTNVGLMGGRRHHGRKVGGWGDHVLRHLRWHMWRRRLSVQGIARVRFRTGPARALPLARSTALLPHRKVRLNVRRLHHWRGERGTGRLCSMVLRLTFHCPARRRRSLTLASLRIPTSPSPLKSRLKM